MISVPHVLIVEDDPSIRGMLTVALRREPLNVDTAMDGVAALEKISQTAYCVLLIDLMLPRLNGFELLDAIRAMKLEHRPIVIVMTAYDESVVKKLDASIVHACVRKPFDVPVLVSLVRECAQRMTEASAGPLSADWAGSATPLQ